MKLAPTFSRPLRALKALLATSILLGATARADAALLYDASQNTLPSAQGWTSIATGGSATVSGGTYVLDTTSTNGIRSGSILTLAAGRLDTENGFDLGIRLNMLSESHANNDRAGFSLLMLGDDQSRALEIGFWTTGIWAYTSSFTQVTTANVSTTGVHDYLLRVSKGRYTLLQDNVQILGDDALVDYPVNLANPLTAIYDRSSTLFFGDDTTSAGAKVNVQSISLTAAPVPLPGALALCLPTLLTLGTLRRRSR